MKPHYHIVPDCNRLEPEYRIIWIDGRGAYVGETMPFATRAEAHRHGWAVIRREMRRRQGQRKV